MDFSAVKVKEENILALRSFLLEGPEAWALSTGQCTINEMILVVC